MHNIYQQNIIDHYKHPRNQGKIEDADHIVYEVNTLCGDGLKFYIKLDETKQKVVDVKFEGDGCAISQASASMLSEELIGMSVEEMKTTVNKDYILEMLGVEINPARLKCALLSLECIKKIN
jgi:nitrogen fixation protein NifU and related proteins